MAIGSAGIIPTGYTGREKQSCVVGSVRRMLASDTLSAHYTVCRDLMRSKQARARDGRPAYGVKYRKVKTHQPWWSTEGCHIQLTDSVYNHREISLRRGALITFTAVR